MRTRGSFETFKEGPDRHRQALLEWNYLLIFWCPFVCVKVFIFLGRTGKEGAQGSCNKGTVMTH